MEAADTKPVLCGSTVYARQESTPRAKKGSERSRQVRASQPICIGCAGRSSQSRGSRFARRKEPSSVKAPARQIKVAASSTRPGDGGDEAFCPGAGVCSGPCPDSAARLRRLGHRWNATPPAASPNMAMPMTMKARLSQCAMASQRDSRERMAAWYPDPVPTSRTVSLPVRPESSLIRAAMQGCEMVCPSPIGRG